MYEHVLTQRQLSAFAAQLRREEKSAGTAEKSTCGTRGGSPAGWRAAP